MNSVPRDVADNGRATDIVSGRSVAGKKSNIERSIASKTADGRSELWLHPVLAEVKAEIQNRNVVSGAPCVIVGGSYRSKTLAAGNANQNIAANDLAYQSEEIAENCSAKAVLPAEPAAIESSVSFVRRLSEQKVEFGGCDVPELCDDHVKQPNS